MDCFAALAMTLRGQVRQIGATGNISLYQKIDSVYSNLHPVPLRGAFAIVKTRGGDAVDVVRALDEGAYCVRQKRVVPTSRCWRECSWVLDISGRYGGKRAVLRGEHVISRKATAQGMSDVLRCPVCSCACS